MKKSSFLLLLLVVLLLSMVVTGCDSKQPTPNPSAPVSEGAKDGPPEEPKNEADNKSPEIPEGMGDRLADTYTRMMESEKYFIKYRTTIEIMEGQEAEAIMEIAVNGDDTVIKSSMAEGESHMIIKDNKTYLIDHNQKTITIMESTDMEDMEETDIDMDDQVYLEDGQGDFLGKTLPYEEYTTDSGSMRYYFDGEKLAGMEIFIDEEMTQIWEIIEFKNSYPADMFTIPDNYEQHTLGS